VFRLPNGVQIEGTVEGFNITDRVNSLTRNVTFGAGSYPANPNSTFNQITAVGDPRSFQLRVRVRF
jgi:hypothetical protein